MHFSCLRLIRPKPHHLSWSALKQDAADARQRKLVVGVLHTKTL